MPAITVERSKDETVVVMCWHDIVAIWIKGPMSIANQRDNEQRTKKWAERCPRGIGMMVVIEEGLPMPSAEVKRELNAIYDRLAPIVRGAAYVIHGGGLYGSMVRGSLTAMKWINPKRYPSSFAADVKQGAQWLYCTLGDDDERGTVDQFADALSAAARGEEPMTLRTRS